MLGNNLVDMFAMLRIARQVQHFDRGRVPQHQLLITVDHQHAVGHGVDDGVQSGFFIDDFQQAPIPLCHQLLRLTT